MGRQRNRPQTERTREQDKIEASDLSDRGLKVIIIRILNRMEKKNIETIKRVLSGIKNEIPEINNILEGINSRLDEIEVQKSDLKDKVEKNTQAKQQKEKIILKE